MSNRSNSGLPPRRAGGQGAARRPGAQAPARKGKKTGKSKASRLGRTLLTLFLVAVLAAAGIGAYLYFKLDRSILDAGVDKPVPPGQSAQVKPITMLLLGTDYREEHKSYLTDVIMVAALNPDTKSATLVSMPRDTYFELDGYKKNKINEYYTRFKKKEQETGESAEDAMKKMMGKYFGIDIDYATVLDFQGFRDVVDEFGGVSVNVQYDMCYRDTADGTDINLKAGPAKLSGDKALDYVRYRKSNCSPKTKGSDDFDRNRRQSEVLHGLIDRMQSLGGALKIGSVFDAVGSNMKTDVENEQIKNLIAKYWNISKEDVEFKPVTGRWDSPYVYVDESSLREARQALQNRLSGAASPASGTAEGN